MILLKEDEEKRSSNIQPPSQREGDREAVVGVSKVGREGSIDCNVEGNASADTDEAIVDITVRDLVKKLVQSQNLWDE